MVFLRINKDHFINFRKMSLNLGSLNWNVDCINEKTYLKFGTTHAAHDWHRRQYQRQSKQCKVQMKMRKEIESSWHMSSGRHEQRLDIRHICRCCHWLLRSKGDPFSQRYPFFYFSYSLVGAQLGFFAFLSKGEVPHLNPDHPLLQAKTSVLQSDVQD